MAHAILSPSSAERWLACTPSPRMEEGYDDQSSSFAEEGTLAHALAEVHLRHHDDKKALSSALKKLKKDPLYEKYYCDEMDEHARGFADFVLEQCTDDYVLEVEQRLDLTKWVPEGFGTGDAIVVKDGILNLNDLKYGRGVKVSAVENKQLMIYALGCIEKYGWVYDFHTVRLNIYQPRLNNISIWRISVEELLKWADEELAPRADMAFSGEGEHVPGTHCRFCKAKADCRALADFSLELAKEEFREPAKLSVEEKAEILPKLDILEMFIKALREDVYATLLGGGTVPGYKLVKGRSTRVYTDVDAIRAELHKHGFTDDQINTPPKEPTLLPLTALEKVLKKKTFTEIVGPFLSIKEGNPAIAPESDPRDEYSAVENDFADELND